MQPDLIDECKIYFCWEVFSFMFSMTKYLRTLKYAIEAYQENKIWNCVFYVFQESELHLLSKTVKIMTNEETGFPFILYDCEVCSTALRDAHKVEAPENTVLRKCLHSVGVKWAKIEMCEQN